MARSKTLDGAAGKLAEIADRQLTKLGPLEQAKRLRAFERVVVGS